MTNHGTDKYIIFRGWVVPMGFVSDGCTFAPDKIFGVDWTDACIMHDFARRHLVHHKKLTVTQADWMFRQHLKQLGMPRWLAGIFWIGVKVMRPWFRRTRPIPDQWRDFMQMHPPLQ